MKKKAVIDPNRCDRSPFCPVKRVCPVKAVSQDVQGFFKAGPAKVDPEVCIGCGKCVAICPMQAVKMK